MGCQRSSCPGPRPGPPPGGPRTRARLLADDPDIDKWIERLGEARISAGRVNSIGEALDRPLGAEPGIVQPNDAWPPLLRLPIDREGACVRRSPPLLAEHSAELREAGFEDAAIDPITGA